MAIGWQLSQDSKLFDQHPALVDFSGNVQRLRSTDLSIRSIRHAHGVLRTALTHAAAVEIVERNVARLIKPPTLERKEVTILTADQIADTLKRFKDHSLYPVVAVAIGTGARRGEIGALRWSDLDLDGATVRIERALEQTADGIRCKNTKTAAGRRTISLPAFTLDALRNHRRKQLELRMALGIGALPSDAPVFGDVEGDWPNLHSISDRWRDVVKRWKLPKVTFHALRHSHASALIAAGLDVVSVSRRLGHASTAPAQAAVHIDTSRALSKAGITATILTSEQSPDKAAGSSIQPLSPADRAYFQGQLDEIAGVFIADVAKGRRVSESIVLSRFGAGRTKLAPASKRAGMIDEIGDISQALLASGSAARIRARGLGPLLHAALSREDVRARRLKLLKAQ